ncbi:EAL domain-containing protein [Cellulomonas sp. ATA003]|uniref:putative bifunctional diguanylate cyclase/phosphodiesterase n=1 Tax=Cellulomonas sp. ATA003 TaxID=3073064 RepID=UPI002873628E|nr:EAL domain-containing protein [Cellulomonas sp. ATA003]WNB84889.1 EAL domain-containing protein [Cellulomonas sp. ATA003]
MTDAVTAPDTAAWPLVVVTLVAALALAAVVVLLVRSRREAARTAAIESRLRAVRRRDDALEELTGTGALVQSVDGRVHDLTDGARRVLGLADAADPRGRAISDLPVVFLDDAGRSLTPASVLGHRASAAAGRATEPVVVGVQGAPGPDGRPRRLRVRSAVLPATDADDALVVTALVDLAAGTSASAAAAVRAVLRSAPVPMALTDLDGRVVDATGAFAEALGSRPGDVVGRVLPGVGETGADGAGTGGRGTDGLGADGVGADGAGAAGAGADGWRDAVAALVAGGRHRFSLERRVPRAEARHAWVALDVALVRHPSGQPEGLLVTARDVSEYRERSEAMTHRAMHDPLTGLANRALLQEVLRTVLDRAGAEGTVAVLACDLDEFKPINDRYGHAAGDEVLVHVAGVLRAAAGGAGTVARLGGDEFVVVLPAVRGPQAVLEAAGAVHAGLREPVRLHGHPVTVRASVGVAIASADLVARGAPGLLAAADAALYRAKAAGRSRTEVYDPSMQDAGAPVAPSDELADAMARGELVLHLEPLVDLADGAVVGHEAVVRWQHPTRGLLLPPAFRPAAEAAGLTGALTRHVLGLAAASLRDAARTGGTAPAAVGTRLAVTVPASVLGDGAVVESLVADLPPAGPAGGPLVVLLTEASTPDGAGRVRRDLEVLRAAGVAVVLDGFGVGSSLTAVRDLPLDGVRLDPSFTAGLADDPAAARVTRAVGVLAAELGLATIAAGVRTEEQATVLRDGGWRYAQGWLFGVAYPAHAPG